MYDRFDELSRTPFDTVDRTEDLLLADMDELPTVESLIDPVPHTALREVERDEETLSTSLPVDARRAYETFCDIDSAPLWVSVVKSVRILSRTSGGRAKRAAFLARLQNASIGYTVHYRYNERERIVTWGTAAGSLTLVAGRAQFIPMGDRATLMQYQLTLELPEDALPPWEDPFLSGHATSVVMNDFRDYVTRLYRR